MNFLTTTTESYISLFFTLALMLVLLYFMIYRPQKKQECHQLCREAEHGQRCFLQEVIFQPARIFYAPFCIQ